MEDNDKYNNIGAINLQPVNFILCIIQKNDLLH